MSGLYSKARERFLGTDMSWLDDTIRGVLTTDAYTPDLDTDEYLADIPLAARAAVSEELASKTATNGWASAERIEWLTVTGAVRTALVLFVDTGDASTSPLLAVIDSNVTNLPLDPTGAKVTFLPDADTGLFRL